jgi:hypothetical protein
LIVGDRYCEPQGSCKIENITTGDTCEIIFKVRGAFSTKEKDKCFSSATIKNKNGEVKYTIQGKYT